MPNTNTRWYRILTLANLGTDHSAYINHVDQHLLAIPNIISHSWIPTLASDGTSYIQLITTVVMNGSKAGDDAAMFGLADHLLTAHGYNVNVQVVVSDQVYP